MARLAVEESGLYGVPFEVVAADGDTGYAPQLAIDGAGHNDLFEVAGPDYLESLGEHFRAWIITTDRTP